MVLMMAGFRLRMELTLENMIIHVNIGSVHVNMAVIIVPSILGFPSLYI